MEVSNELGSMDIQEAGLVGCQLVKYIHSRKLFEGCSVGGEQWWEIGVQTR